MEFKRTDFESALTQLVEAFIDDNMSFDNNPQIRVNPQDNGLALVYEDDFLRETDQSDEDVEDEAAADDPVSEEDTDYQASRIPDFYPLRSFIKEKDGKRTADLDAIEKLTIKYYGK